MGNTKRGKRYLVLFLVFSLVITTCIANSSVPDSQAKKKKQTITRLYSCSVLHGFPKTNR